MSDDVEARVRAITARLGGHTDRDDEREILEQLAGASDEALPRVLEKLDLESLLFAVDDRAIGPSHYTPLLTMLCRERIGALPVELRAALVLALSSGNTSDVDERALRDVFLSTKGAELTRLKNAIDRGDDHRDLQHVVFSDVDADEVRAAILAHLATEASALERAEVKVLSDIDDTFYCNWKDTRFPPKTVYPGVRQLYVELDRGPHPTPGRLGDLAFVTARPRDRPGWIERATHKTLREHGLTDATVLAGSFTKLHGDDAIAAGKLANFVDYAALFAEYDFVFLGDSGQGDAAFGQAMLEREPERVRAVLIHDVVRSDAATRAGWRERGVSFFDTYIGAAIEALERGLITKDGVTRVRDAAFDDFAAITFEDDAEHATLRATLRAELDRDAARV